MLDMRKYLSSNALSIIYYYFMYHLHAQAVCERLLSVCHKCLSHNIRDAENVFSFLVEIKQPN